jgi:carboxyl-terminal processing protease
MRLRWLCIAALAALTTAAALSADAEERTGAAPADYDISKGVVFDRVVLAIVEQYYDPDRADPQAMLRGALTALEKSVAEVKVDVDDTAHEAVVSVLSQRLEVRLDAVSAPWDLSKAMRAVFAFLAANLPKDEKRDPREIEYAAVNGMLSVLDPHSGAMMPKEWQELRMRLEGEFEGIGIRITTDRRPPCNGDLTVVEVFPDTPAARAGMRAGDKIARIEGDSTVNITTDEAANRLRGAHGTKVKVQLKRADGQLLTMEIPRGTIAIESVKSKMLADDVGYVSLTEFQQDSAAEVAAALEALRKKGMKGLVLDIRDNPGGSLDAASEIADLFLASGTIVTTAGRHYDDREVRDAVAKGTEPAYPLVILTNAYSASAAEVISGALRNHGRALIVGDTTFGKGSVQSIVPLPGDGALRLTIAQYLTPGDISIQGVGVAPDVRLVPVLVDKDEMNLEIRGPTLSERDLDAHLVRPNELERTDRSGLLTAPLLVPNAERKADLAVFDRCYDPDPERLPFKARSELELARRIAAGATGATTGDLVLVARKLIDEDEAEDAAAIAQALRKIGIDWSAPPSGAGAASESAAVVATAKLIGKLEAGQKIRISATVKNGADATAYRLRATTKSDNPFLDDVEIVFGKVEPGAQRKWEAVVELPPVLSGRVDPVEVRFEAASGPIPRPVVLEAAFAAPRRALLSYSWHVEDLGNGNGVAEPGEELAFRVWLTNIGDAPTFDADVQLAGGPGVDVVKGHLPLGRLAPGKSAEGEMRMKVSPGFDADDSDLHLAVEEWISGRFSTTRSLLDRTIRLPVVSGSPSPSKAAGTVTVTGASKIALTASPSADGAIVGWAQPGAVFPVDARIAASFRVVLDGGLHAWIAEASTRPGGEGAARFERAVVRPPEIHLEGGEVRTASGKTIRIEGFVSHPDGIRDVIAFVGDKKVAYVPNRSPGPSGRLDFAIDLPLSVGANEAALVARHDGDVWISEPLFIRRAAE